MQQPNTRSTSLDTPIGHTLSPVDAILHRSTAAQLQTLWVLHFLHGEPMQPLHILLMRPVLDCMAVHNITQPGSPHF
jgi:hypothetical protein